VNRATTIRIGLLALIWGSGFLWIKLGIRGLSPVEVTLARLVLGSAVLFIVVAVRRGSLPRSLVVWMHITVAALFANAAPYLLFAVGEQHVASATAGMLNATTPLWTVAIALGTRHQRVITARQAAGLVIGFGGAVLIFSPGRPYPGWLPSGRSNASPRPRATRSATSTWTGSWPVGASAQSSCRRASSGRRRPGWR
jgi:drug/metabolite transporter (DMT)-like permease